ncbi:hypothetical protein ACQPZP_14515 [Spirillospora sp. CA-142024]|uniref:hypothetical protein n=1 Tax=Spirillospora sp. CA-142024 TaxID=3240036 RepID=UPI003D94908B
MTDAERIALLEARVEQLQRQLGDVLQLQLQLGEEMNDALRVILDERRPAPRRERHLRAVQ